MVLLTSLGMCGLKLNTGLLSGKPGALSYLFCIFMKTPILWCPLSQAGGSSPAWVIFQPCQWSLVAKDCTYSTRVPLDIMLYNWLLTDSFTHTDGSHF